MTAKAASSSPPRGSQSHGFDEGRLEYWMRDNIEGFEGPLNVERCQGGQSNPTYKIQTRAKVYAMRRKPPGPLLKGAHAIEREVRVQQALAKAGFPAAHVHALCSDVGVIGSSFYVMEWIDGRIIWDASFPAVARNERPRYFDAMNEALARLHTIDYEAIGLGDYGRKGNYFQRQIARWAGQYAADTDAAGRDANLERLIDWLPAHIPAGDETSIVHGDFRVDNLIFHPAEPRILAVLDWELSTLGSPLADFANHLMMYRMPPRIVAGLLGTDLASMNIPSQAEFVRAYCRRTGRDAIPDLDFFVAFNMFRLAAIFHGIKGRLARGTAFSPRAQEYAAGVSWMAELAWRQAMAPAGT
jgi:aminoglycoside phosphotransferase (APT) family kinase protein